MAKIPSLAPQYLEGIKFGSVQRFLDSSLEMVKVAPSTAAWAYSDRVIASSPNLIDLTG